MSDTDESALEEAVIHIRKLIENDLKCELHIMKVERRRLVHEELFSDKKLDIHLKQMWSLYLADRNLVENQNEPQVKLTFKFLESLRLYYDTFKSNFHTECEDDLRAVYNYYGSRVLLREQVLCNVDGTQISQKGASDEAAATLESRSTLIPDESERGLYTLGGGTLALVWKMCKRRKESAVLTLQTRIAFRKCYRLSLEIRMTDHEKENIPTELKEIDKGGLFFPKNGFLPFISAVNNHVRKFANEDAFKKLGEGMLKVCVSEVKNLKQLWKLFLSGLQKESVIYEDNVAKHFFNIWLTKIVHARIQEFVSTFTNTLNKNKKLQKGGLSLRDTLHALTNRNKKTRNSKVKRMAGNNRVKGGSSSNKKNSKTAKNRKSASIKKKKILQNIKKSCSTEETLMNKPLTSPICTARPIRKRRHLIDVNFIYD